MLFEFRIVLGAALCACAFAHQPQPPAHLAIRVLNPAGVPPGTLASAEELAGRIFRAAGVELAWIDCESAPCPGDTGAGEFWLHILKQKPRRLAADSAGFAVLIPPHSGSASYAGVSFAAVQQTARQLDADASQLLGATIAHEIGHLLLGAHSHSRSGIMLPRFRLEEISQAGHGVLLFEPAQARAIRADVLERMALAHGSPVAQ